MCENKKRVTLQLPLEFRIEQFLLQKRLVLSPEKVANQNAKSCGQKGQKLQQKVAAYNLKLMYDYMT